MNNPEQSSEAEPLIDQHFVKALQQIGLLIHKQVITSLSAKHTLSPDMKLLDESMEKWMNQNGETRQLLAQASFQNTLNYEDSDTLGSLFHETAVDFQLAVEVFLKQKYPDFKVDSIGGDHITLSGPEWPAEDASIKRLLVSFQLHKDRLQTNLAYSYIPTEETDEPLRREVLDSATTVVEGISVSDLKEDVLDILESIIERDEDTF